MKIYFDYSDEEYSSEEEEEILEDCFEEESRKKSKIVVTKNSDDFDEDYFDYVVAKSIVKIHRKNDDFSNWVNQNLKHLESLYKLANMNIEPVDFYGYIYDCTKI